MSASVTVPAASADQMQASRSLSVPACWSIRNVVLLDGPALQGPADNGRVIVARMRGLIARVAVRLILACSWVRGSRSGWR